MGIKKYITDRVGNLGEVLFGTAGLFLLITLSIWSSIQLSCLIDKGEFHWGLVGLFFVLSITNTVFVLGALVVLKRSKDLFNIVKIETESDRLEKITKKFINGSVTEELNSEKGIIKSLDDLNTEFDQVHQKLHRYAVATQYVAENVVIINSPGKGEHVLRSFFDDANLAIHRNMINCIQFTGTGRGAVNGGNRAYNLYEPLTLYLKEIFCDQASQLKEFKGIGSRKADQQACFRTFFYMVIHYLLERLEADSNSHKIENFKISFIFPQNEVFPGMLTIGNIKSMFNVSLARNDAEHIIELMPLALQVNAFGKKENDEPKPQLTQTIERITCAFNNRFDDYSGNKEEWCFTRTMMNKTKVSVCNINKEDIGVILTYVENEINSFQKIFGDAKLEFDPIEVINKFREGDINCFAADDIESLNLLKNIYTSFAMIGYGTSVPDIIKKK